MLARCARCQGTFTTDRYGRQFCPHCGSELILPDPNAPQPPAPPEGGQGAEGAAPPEGAPGWGQPPPPPPRAGGAPPPPPPIPGAGGVSPPPPGGGWAPLPPPPPPPPPPEGGIPAPFADRRGRSFFGAFFETWKLVATEPQKFFTHVRIQLGPAIWFGVLASWVGGAVGALLSLGMRSSMVGSMERSFSSLPPDQAEKIREVFDKFGAMSGAGVLVTVVAAPLFTLLSMFVVAGIVHLVLLMFSGAARGFEATLTVVAFSFGVYLLDAIPQCGPIVALVWQAVILIIGLAAIHRTTTGKTAAAVLLPGVLCCCCVCLGAWGVIMAVAGALGGIGGSGTANL